MSVASKMTPAAGERLPDTLHPIGALAADLVEFARGEAAAPVLYVARDGARARSLYALLQALVPQLAVAHLPAWDCPPYDRASPSRAVMGQRMGTLRWLTGHESPPALVLTTPDALLRRVPPPGVWPEAHVGFRVGEPLDAEAAGAALARIGYVLGERVDEPGEAAVRGRVVEIFPAAATHPCRIVYDDEAITAIHSYDPATQRSLVETAFLAVDPASEIVLQPEPARQDGVDPGEPEERAMRPGREHRLSAYYRELATVFDYAPKARLLAEAGASERAEAFLDAVREGYESEMAFRDGGRGERAPVPPDHLFVDRRTWEDAFEANGVGTVGESSGDTGRGVPRFAADRGGGRAFADFVRDRLKAGGRMVLAGPEASLKSFRQRARRLLGTSAEPVEDWHEAIEAAPGSLVSLVLPLDEGFVDLSGTVAVVAAADLLGSRARASHAAAGNVLSAGGPAFRVGQPVIHRDHGVGILEGLEEVNSAEGTAGDAIRLRYEGDATLMVPVEEIGTLWSYGGDADAVPLDRLKGEAWAKRRADIDAAVRATAGKLVEEAKQRRERKAPKLVPETAGYERFVGRFAYPLTPDQAAATDAVLADLASGRRMDRLICGDVGYGKTEVALRAAAAAAFAGRQVALVAPTTVLVRQHLRTLRRRFAGFGIKVAEVSRMVKPAEARRVKAGLKDGTIRIVVGTHAVAAKGVGFADLGLVVLDEEQRFGARVKTQLKRLAEEAHVLTLTATPIPRTLQASLVGLQDLSVIETPPVARQPVRTAVAPFDEAAVREALRREKARGGQSFVVCPRIADIEPMAQRLRSLAPDLAMTIAHGEMPPAEIDAAMLGFADGKGDVLLATNIIESGLDVPNANTMIVWRADRFGLAQLHQLRGRVGRGARRGAALLLTEPGEALAKETEKRLRSLEELDHLGAGFDISGRDLDLRGAGDLLGEEQAGHIRLIGMRLYRHLLERAIRAAEGAALADEWSPEVRLGLSGRIPKDYIPEDEVRIDLYARFAEAGDADALEDLEDEVADRFGPLPQEVADLLAVADIRVRCHEAGILELDGGPQALAASFRAERIKAMKDRAVPDGLDRSGDRLLLRKGSDDARERLELARELLGRIEAGA